MTCGCNVCTFKKACAQHYIADSHLIVFNVNSQEYAMSFSTSSLSQYTCANHGTPHNAALHQPLTSLSDQSHLTNCPPFGLSGWIMKVGSVILKYLRNSSHMLISAHKTKITSKNGILMPMWTIAILNGLVELFLPYRAKAFATDRGQGWAEIFLAHVTWSLTVFFWRHPEYRKIVALPCTLCLVYSPAMKENHSSV